MQNEELKLWDYGWLSVKNTNIFKQNTHARMRFEMGACLNNKAKNPLANIIIGRVNSLANQLSVQAPMLVQEWAWVGSHVTRPAALLAKKASRPTIRLRCSGKFPNSDL